MKLIGKGAFTKAFLNTHNEVILHTNDYAKECMASYWFPESRLFPKIETVEEGVYKMDYLGKTPKSLKQELRPRQYRLYKALREVFNNVSFIRNDYDSYNVWYEALSKLPSEFRKERETILEALDAMSNYGSDVTFEISPRNVRAKNGFLVLLDVFFFRKQLSKRMGF